MCCDLDATCSYYRLFVISCIQPITHILCALAQGLPVFILGEQYVRIHYQSASDVILHIRLHLDLNKRNNNHAGGWKKKASACTLLDNRSWHL